jgi:hypothetical protein
MPRTPAPSLEAWPGEAAQPPLRLLQRAPRRPEAPPASLPAVTWLQRLREALRHAGRSD